LKGIIRFFEICFSFVAVILIFGIWRLSIAPVQVDFVIPILSEMLSSPNARYTVEIESAFLELGFEEGRFLEIRVDNLGILQPDGTVLTTIPKTIFSVSARALLHGDIAPKQIILEKPFFQVVIPKTEKSDSPETDVFQDISKKNLYVLNTLRTIFEQVKYLQSFEVRKAELIFEDADKNLHLTFPEISFFAERKKENLYKTTLSAELYLTNRFMDIGLDGWLDSLKNTYSFQAHFKNIYLSYLGEMIPVLRGADLTVDGWSKGEVFLPDFEKDKTVILETDKYRKYVHSLSFGITADKGGIVSLPDPLNWSYEIKKARLGGVFSPALESLSIKDSKIELYGPQVSLNGEITGIGDFLDTGSLHQVKTTLKSVITKVPTGMVPKLWPASVGEKAHQWVSQNLTNGQMEQSDFQLYFTGKTLTDLNGTVQAKGVTVRYLDETPVVENVDGTVLLKPDTVVILADKGHTGDMQLKHARLEFLDLQSDNEKSKMVIEATGPVEKALEILDSPSLDLLSGLGTRPEKISGDGEVHLELAFDLKQDLKPEEVDVYVEADLNHIEMISPFSSDPMKKGTFHLTADNNGLDLKGHSYFGIIPFEVSWHENFNKTAAFRSKYDLKASFSENDLLDVSSFIQEYLKGKINISVTAQMDFKNMMTMQGKFDLNQADIYVPFISYQKKKNDALKGTFSYKGLLTQKRKKIGFTLSSSALKNKVSVIGSALLEPKKKQVSFSRFQTGLNDFEGRFVQEKSGDVAINLKGNFLDISGLFHPVTKTEKIHRIQLKEVEKQQPNKTISVDIDVASLKLAKEEEPLKNASVHGNRRGAVWSDLSFEALAVHAPILASLDKTGRFSIRTDDFGSLLKIAGYSQRIHGGILKLEGQQDKTGRFKGTVRVKSFELSNMSFLQQAMTIIGIVGAFGNDRIAFKEARLPFELSPEYVLKLQDGVVSGNSLGFTINGYADYKELDFVGTIVPAYAINSLLGKIPLIGGIFSSDKGGGLLSVNYSLKGTPENPEVKVNPFTILTPGFIQKMFMSTPEEIKN
jgi:hypothetical protein